MASAPPAARSAASAAPSPWRVVHQLAELDIDLDRGRMLGLTTLQFRRVHTAAGDAAYAAAPPPLRLHCRVGHVHGVWANGEACPFEMLDSSGQWVGGAHARDLDGFHVLQREALCAAEEGELAITLPQGPLPPVVLGEGAAETSGLSPLLSPTTELHVTIRYELRRPQETGGAGPVCDGGGVAFVAVDGRDDGTAAAAYGGYGGGYGPQSVGGAGGGAGGGGGGAGVDAKTALLTDHEKENMTPKERDAANAAHASHQQHHKTKEAMGHLRDDNLGTRIDHLLHSHSLFTISTDDESSDLKDAHLFLRHFVRDWMDAKRRNWLQTNMCEAFEVRLSRCLCLLITLHAESTPTAVARFKSHLNSICQGRVFLF